MRGFQYLLTLMVIGLSLHYCSKIKYRYSAGDTYAEIPANMFIYAKEDVNKQYFNTALEHIDNAIVVMRETEALLDEESVAFIESAIADLYKVERTLKTGLVSEEENNYVFAKALNSLAYAYLRLSENAIEEDDQLAALSALAIAVKQLDHSLRFATGDLFRAEGELMTTLADLQEQGELDLDQLHPLTEDLRSLVASQ